MLCLSQSIQAGRTDSHRVGAYEQQTSISHKTRRWEVQDQGVGRFAEPDSWLTDGHLLAVFSPGGRTQRGLWGLLYKSTNLIHEGATLVP